MVQVNNNPILDYETSWEGYSGASIENFIKQRLGFTPVYYNGKYYKSYFFNSSNSSDEFSNKGDNENDWKNTTGVSSSSSCRFTVTLKNTYSFIVSPGTLSKIVSSNNETIYNSNTTDRVIKEDSITIDGILYNVYLIHFDVPPKDLLITITLNQKL